MLFLPEPQGLDIAGALLGQEAISSGCVFCIDYASLLMKPLNDDGTRSIVSLINRQDGVSGLLQTCVCLQGCCAAHHLDSNASMFTQVACSQLFSRRT